MISVIVPVLNDTVALTRCLAALKRESNISTQLIVVDGGPSDDCKRVTLDARAEYLTAPRGRASQMNAGAKLARGEWLWFLHADCVPHPDSLQAIADLAPSPLHPFSPSINTKSPRLPVTPSCTWGCFKHRIDAPGLALRVIECADNLRAKHFSMPYGDQGIFVRRELFEKLGGYENVTLLEDVKLAQALKKHSRPKVLAPVLISDARRWIERGVLRTTFINWKIMWLYMVMGRSPEHLAGLYQSREKFALEQSAG